MDFSKLTLEQIDALDKDFVKHLSSVDFQAFYIRNKELGREYLVGGKKKWIEKGQPIYGKESKELLKNPDGKWEIWVSACGLVYIENPDVVDEETFIKTMLNLGVSKEKLDKFIKYEDDFD